MRINFDDIFRDNEAWVQSKIAIDPTHFERLAKGQNPEVLYIGCADSRVTAEELMGARAGEIFVHRNVANVVVATDTCINAVVQYAVEILKVQHIVVCGHYECGGVNAAMHPRDMGGLNSWLATIRDVYRIHQDELDAITDQRERYDRLVELNVLEQCLNIVKIDHVQRAWSQTGYPIIHGWVFNVRTGKLVDLKLNVAAEFASIRRIYDLMK
jgi:carbonic anhydrase